MIIIVFGLPGSGKSFFASRLAANLHAVYVNTDEVRLNMFPDKREYTDAEKTAVYDALLSKMDHAIMQDQTIILDGTFYKKSLRQPFEEAVAAHNHQIIYIEVTAPEDVIKERVSRPREFSEATYEVYLKLRQEAEPLEADHLILDSTRPVEEMITQAITYINLRT
jgi:predicted kinase